MSTHRMLRMIMPAALVAALSAAAVAQPAPAPPPVKHAPPTVWTSPGWEKLAVTMLSHDKNSAEVAIGRDDGRFEKLLFVSEDGMVELYDVKIKFGNNDQMVVKTNILFQSGTKTHEIALPGESRFVKKVTFFYKGVPNSGPARLGVYGKTATAPANPPPSTWSPAGWEKLGAAVLTAKQTSAMITIGRNDGRFEKLMLVSEDGAVELYNVSIKFGNNETMGVKTSFVFSTGMKTHPIDLPGETRYVKTVTFAYRKIPNTGRAQIAVYGKAAAAPVTPPAPPTWSPNGWDNLGTTILTPKKNRAAMRLAASNVRFDKLMLVAENGSVELYDVMVRFGNNEVMKLATNFVFSEGMRTNPIDLPGETRLIKSIEFRYRKIPRTGQARIALFGHQGAIAAPTPVPTPAPVNWNPAGWQLLGEDIVDGRADVDRIKVGKKEGRFTKLMLVVLDSDLELTKMVVKLKSSKLALSIRQLFKEGSRTRAIDLPGEQTIIKGIELFYGNTPGTGRARVQIWAQ